MVSQETHKIDKARLDEAADWHVRLMDDAAAEADWVAFTDWLESHDQNRHAYDHVEDIVVTLDQPADVRAVVLSAHSNPEKIENTVIDASARFGRPRMWAGIAAAAAAVWLVAVNMTGLFSSAPVTEYYETASDTTRLVTLGDGTTVHMNINSKLEVTLSKESRQTELAYGEALFSVAKDADRPFYVALGDREVRVVGTVFNILRHDGEVTVTVEEGIVDVAASKDVRAAKTERLVAGKQLKHIEGTQNTVVAIVDTDAATAWREGFLEYEEATLAEVVADLNRYFEPPIEVDEDIAGLTFSGILSTKDQRAVLDLLIGVLPIETVETADKIILKRKSKD